MHSEVTVSSPYGSASVNSLDMLIGQGTAFQELLEQIRLVAQSDCRVLLVGEEGSGKETFARAIHTCSVRSHLPFQVINCADFHPNASQHPLHMLTQADGSSPRADQRDFPIDLAHGGTLYLHEVGALTPEAQTWLLRCLLTIEMEALNKQEKANEDELRVIAGTSRNLQEDVARHCFRADLFYRLNVVPLHIPPLRRRLEDIEALVHYFVNMYAGKYGKTIDAISEKTIEVLRNYDWPKNLEELRGVLERAVILSKSPTLYLEHIVQDPANFPLHS